MNGPVLRDIHVPPAGCWPLAPGWWLLIAVSGLALVGAVLWLRHRARRAPLRAALAEVDRLAAQFARDDNAERLVDGASRLLRRVARRVEPSFAAIDGAEWRAFAQRYARDAHTRRALDELLDARFRIAPKLDAGGLPMALRTWCRTALAPRGSRRPRAGAGIRGRLPA